MNTCAIRSIGSTLLLALACATARADLGAVDGVFAIRPATESAYVAVAIAQSEGSALGGLRWFHNDEQSAFPRLILMEGVPGSPPDLANSALILEDLSGESLAWGSITLETPVISSTGLIYAVFQFPAEELRTSEGAGGGPGIGYRQLSTGQASPAYITADGASWDRVRRDYDVPIEPVWSAGKMEALSLADLASIRRATESESQVTSPSDALAKTADATQPLRVAPNPFNPRTVISVYLAAAGLARVEIIDLRGRRVAVLHSGELPAGQQSLIWDGVDARGKPVASGVYWVRANLAGSVHTRRVSLVR